MRSSVYALAGSAASALAAVRGFNYAAQEQTYDTFLSSFNTAASLVGADDFTSARLYTMIQTDTTNTVISAIPAAIATNTTLLLGLWASEDQAAFDDELTALRDAISQYGSDFADLVVGISVGSEDLYRNSVTGIENDSGVGQQPSVLVDYISQVRTAIEGTVLSSKLVGHVDTWNVFVNSSNSAVIAACDFLGLDEYPYYQTTDVNDISNASTLFFEAYDKVVAVAGDLPIYITETGWPVSGSVENEAVASTANAETYWQDVACELESRDLNFWWYILTDSSSPDFSVTSALGEETPLYKLSCNTTSSSSTSSSSSAAASKTSKTESSVAAATTPSSAADSTTVAIGTPVPTVKSGSNGTATATGVASAGTGVYSSGAALSGASGSTAGAASATLGSTWSANLTASATGSGASTTAYAGAATKMDAGSMAALALGAVAAVMAL